MGTFGVKRASDEKFCPSTLGASQAPQCESSPESKLSYPANPINTWKCSTLDSTILARLPFLPEKIASSKRDLI